MRRTARHLLLIAATAATTAPAARAADPGGASTIPKPPQLKALACLSLCEKASRLTVRPGARIKVKGRRLVRGYPVSFVARPGTRTVAPLRITKNGLVVTVPADARTGRIFVADTAGQPSNKLGVHVHRPRPVVTSVPLSGTPFDGNGMWIWYMNKSEGGDVDAIIARAQAAGITTLFIKSSDGATNFWSQFTPELIARFHAAGIRVCGWQYVYGTKPTPEAELGARAVQAGADCLVIDAETEYEGKYSQAQTYMNALRAAIGPTFPVGLAGWPYADYHPSYPTSVFLGPNGAQYSTPQMYWKTIGTSVDNVYAHTFTWNRIYNRPIFPLGQTYDGVSGAELTRFRQLAVAYGATGLSWWDWQETTASQWTALGQPLTALEGFAPATAWPKLDKGDKGDQVLWMQEHLAAADASTPTSGQFDAATDTALRNFQTARQIPVTGATDEATWRALLELAPVAVDWTGGGGPKSARSARVVRDELSE